MQDKQQLHPAESPLQKHDVELELRKNDQESLYPNQSGELAPDVDESGSFGQVLDENHSLSKDSPSDGNQITDSGRCLQVGTYSSQASSPDCDNGFSLVDIEEKRYSSPNRCHSLNRKDVEANNYSIPIQGQPLTQALLSSEPHGSYLEDTIPVGKNCVPKLVNVSSDDRIPCTTSSHGDIYGQRIMSDNIYHDGRGLLMQQPNWNTNVAQIGVTTQPLLNNWQSKSMWANTNGVECASQSSYTGTERDLNLLRVANNAEQIIQRESSSDQSLFSVFSQCSQLRCSKSTIESESSSGQVVASGNYEMLMGGGNNLAQPTNPLDFLSGSNPATSFIPEDAAWMNQSRQNPGLHDPLGKLYPRSWNP